MLKNIKSILTTIQIDKLSLFFGVLLSLFSTVTSLIFPLLLKNIVDALIKNNFSFYYIILLILVASLDLAFTGLSMYLLSKVGEKVVLNLREKIWRKILDLNLNFFEKNSSGEVVSRLMNDTNLLMEVFSTEVAEFITSLFTIIGTIIILIKIDPLLTSVIIITIPIMAIIVIPLGKFLFQNSKEVQKANAGSSKYIVDKLNNIRLLKMSDTFEQEVDLGNYNFQRIYSSDMQRNKIQSIITPLIMLILISTIIGIIFLGAYRVIKGFVSPGNLFAFIVYIIQLMPTLITVATFWNKLNIAMGATNRIDNILNLSGESTNSTKNLSNTINTVNSLKLKNITLIKDKHTIINDFSYTFKINNFYNIVGFSGSGKSTLFNIICKFYPPTSGTLYINNNDKLTIKDWRNNIAYVTQNVNMFEDTLKNNLLYGIKDTYTDSELLNLLSKVGLSDIVSKLPKGLDTIISRDSFQLSGGEKQRLALLRGVLSKKPILLVDEVSSNVDSKNDYIIYNFLKHYNENRIIITITHKLSNFDDTDHIILLKNGSIISSGNERDLLKNSPSYQELKKYYNGNKNN
ncbi:ABC transporter ATP-binding protein [Lactobacillus taiwanensis]|uniref:ABC transporter ATP-binding protein n=1 Tax=Lactobacillus taiwanensis TaxID=508451 RepID=UPI0032208F04